MKKCNHKSQLELEQMKLRLKELELEKSIRHNWTELKKGLSPEAVLKNVMPDEAGHPSVHKHWLVNVLSYGASVLTHKLTEKAGDTIESKVQKGVDYFLGKVEKALQKKTKRKPKG
jgi:hypothetical protein